jgi:N-acetylmuramoyl-L-alanine amidase
MFAVLLASASFLYIKYSKEPVVISETINNVIEDIIKTEPEIQKNGNIVCLDPGHGGYDVGAIYKKLYEADINLTVAKDLQAHLENDGYTVYMTRSDDSFVEKRARSTYCNSVNADILVSIHHNTYDADHSVNYSTVLYYKDSDKLLASSILKSNSELLEIESKGIVKFDNSLFWTANMPSILSEALFMTNTAEYTQISKSNSARLSAEATSLETGIKNYFENPDGIIASTNNDSITIDRIDQDY